MESGFSNFFITLKWSMEIGGPYGTLAAADAACAVTIILGVFINNIVSFLIIGAVIFISVKFVSSLSGILGTAHGSTAVKTCPECPYR